MSREGNSEAVYENGKSVEIETVAETAEIVAETAETVAETAEYEN